MSRLFTASLFLLFKAREIKQVKKRKKERESEREAQGVRWCPVFSRFYSRLQQWKKKTRKLMTVWAVLSILVFTMLLNNFQKNTPTQFFGLVGSTLKSASHLQLYDPSVFSQICIQPPPPDPHSSMSAIRDECVCYRKLNTKKKKEEQEEQEESSTLLTSLTLTQTTLILRMMSDTSRGRAITFHSNFLVN